MESQAVKKVWYSLPWNKQSIIIISDNMTSGNKFQGLTPRYKINLVSQRP